MIERRDELKLKPIVNGPHWDDLYSYLEKKLRLVQENLDNFEGNMLYKEQGKSRMLKDLMALKDTVNGTQ